MECKNENENVTSKVEKQHQRQVRKSTREEDEEKEKCLSLSTQLFAVQLVHLLVIFLKTDFQLS